MSRDKPVVLKPFLQPRQYTGKNIVTIAALGPRVRTSNWILEILVSGDDEVEVWETVEVGDWVFYEKDNVWQLTNRQYNLLFKQAQ